MLPRVFYFINMVLKKDCGANYSPFINNDLKKAKFPENFQRTLGQQVLPNPGSVFDLHRNVLGMMPKFSSGIELHYALNCKEKYKIVFGNWKICNISPSGFRIGGIFASKLNENIGKCPHLQLDINPSSLSTNMVAVLNPRNYLIQFECQSSKTLNEHILKLDRLGESSNTSLALYNSSRKTGRLTLGHLISITSKVRVGLEVFLEWQNYKRSNTFLSIASSYRNDNYTIAATCSPQSLDLSYHQFVNNNLQIGSSFLFNNQSKRTVGAIYYQVKLYDCCVRGMINSDWNLGVEYEKRLHLKHGILTLCFNCLMHMPKGSFVTGLKFHIDRNL